MMLMLDILCMALLSSDVMIECAKCAKECFHSTNIAAIEGPWLVRHSDAVVGQEMAFSYVASVRARGG